MEINAEVVCQLGSIDFASELTFLGSYEAIHSQARYLSLDSLYIKSEYVSRRSFLLVVLKTSSYFTKTMHFAFLLG